jgi:hypothetical protein
MLQNPRKEENIIDTLMGSGDISEQFWKLFPYVLSQNMEVVQEKMGFCNVA